MSNIELAKKLEVALNSRDVDALKDIAYKIEARIAEIVGEDTDFNTEWQLAQMRNAGL